ncbi:MAG TPA: hypothetical protein VGB42_01825 [Candidatus Thermoplasmatota archaeon]
MADGLTTLVAIVVGVVAAAIAMVASARLFLGYEEQARKISIGRFLLAAGLAVLLIYGLALIDWPRGFGALGSVLAFVAVVYTFRYIVLPDTLPAEQWKHAVWMALVTFVILLAVNAVSAAAFDVEPYAL